MSEGQRVVIGVLLGLVAVLAILLVLQTLAGAPPHAPDMPHP